MEYLGLYMDKSWRYGARDDFRFYQGMAHMYDTLPMIGRKIERHASDLMSRSAGRKSAKPRIEPEADAVKAGLEHFRDKQ